MNAIFITVFYQEQYVEMVLLLLESMARYDMDSIQVLIYTSTLFKQKIMESPLYHPSIRIETNDTYDTIGKACGARLDLFRMNLPYEKILYLDTDIMINGPLQQVFDFCTEEKLYVLEEGSPDHPNDFLATFWGKSLFGSGPRPSMGFTSGIMLFPNCDKMRHLFEAIQQDIQRRPQTYHAGFYDQPYIIYQAFTQNLIENKTFSKYAINGDETPHKVIHHFPGGPGVYATKLDIMKRFLYKKKVIQY